MKRLLLLALTITLTGCARPGDHPIGSNCVWIEEDSRSLNLTKAADRRHLRNDAETAEDMAIRWADKYVGRVPEYGRRRDECMEALFNGLARHHGVDVALVRQYRLDRDIVVDSAVILGFGALYAMVAYIFAGRIRRRFPSGEPGFWVMTLTMAVGISLVGVMVGNLWSIINRDSPTEQRTSELQDEPDSVETALGRAVCVWHCRLRVGDADPVSSWSARQWQAFASKLLACRFKKHSASQLNKCKRKDKKYATNLARMVGGLPAWRKSLSGGRMKCGASSHCGLQLAAWPMLCFWLTPCLSMTLRCSWTYAHIHRRGAEQRRDHAEITQRD